MASPIFSRWELVLILGTHSSTHTFTFKSMMHPTPIWRNILTSVLSFWTMRLNLVAKFLCTATLESVAVLQSWSSTWCALMVAPTKKLTDMFRPKDGSYSLILALNGNSYNLRDNFRSKVSSTAKSLFPQLVTWQYNSLRFLKVLGFRINQHRGQPQ